MSYAIEQKEPEGWDKAFLVTWNGECVATFRYIDSAQYYIDEDVMKRNHRANIPACDYHIDMDQN